MLPGEGVVVLLLVVMVLKVLGITGAALLGSVLVELLVMLLVKVLVKLLVKLPIEVLLGLL